MGRNKSTAEQLVSRSYTRPRTCRACGHADAYAICWRLLAATHPGSRFSHAASRCSKPLAEPKQQQKQYRLSATSSERAMLGHRHSSCGAVSQHTNRTGSGILAWLWGPQDACVLSLANQQRQFTLGASAAKAADAYERRAQ